MSEEMLVGFMAVYLVLSLISMGVGIIFYIARWKMFVKAGEAGWKAIIPLYGEYITFKICWEGKFFWIVFGLMFLYAVLLGIGVASFSTIAIIGAIIALIAAIVIIIMMLNRLSRVFGMGVGFTVGLVLLYNFFIMILGFGSAEYKRNE
ncbi:MAG: hypothetical protein IJP31_04270 [Lachnospiraceae bacterium]|nr:hypothetical protein [Lachnospiraceae bacterium]